MGEARLICAAALLGACNTTQPCVTMPMSALLTQAALVRVDVYDAASAQCQGSAVQATAPPLLSHSFPRGTTVRLDVPPGHRVIVMTTFSDAGGEVESGRACTVTNLAGGRAACVSLALSAVDGGVPTCTASPDSCPSGQFCSPANICALGCKSGADCAVAPALRCDPVRHQCVQCTKSSDCTGGLSCSPSGQCAQTCTSTGQCPMGDSCCGGFCVDTRADPLNCSACGSPCTGGDTLCCNGVCANPSTSVTDCGSCGNSCSTLNGAPTCTTGACGWTCSAGFAHCASGNTGCETPDDTVTNCHGCGNACTPTNASTNSCAMSGCSYTCAMGFLDCIKVGANTDGCESSANSVTSCGGCGNVCDTTNSTGATCPAGSCVYAACANGRANCNMANADVDGCECPTAMCCGSACQPQHKNGLGEMYLLACTALGTPGNTATYTLAMAQAARDAWAATGTDGTLGCMAGAQCITRTANGVCATWCYTKMLAGRVDVASDTTCVCPPTSSDWN